MVSFLRAHKIMQYLLKRKENKQEQDKRVLGRDLRHPGNQTRGVGSTGNPGWNPSQVSILGGKCVAPVTVSFTYDVQITLNYDTRPGAVS